MASVAIHGNVAVIGTPDAAPGCSAWGGACRGAVRTGAVYVYERRGDYNNGRAGGNPGGSAGWRQLRGPFLPEEYRRDPGGFEGARYGQSVAVHGDVLVVGAPEERSVRGSATVFRRAGPGGWDEVGRLLFDDDGGCGR